MQGREAGASVGAPRLLGVDPSSWILGEGDGLVVRVACKKVAIGSAQDEG